MAIRPDVLLDQKLAILQTHDPFRTWNSLRDKRFCVLCERTLTGGEIEIRRHPSGKVELHCPTANCNAGPNLWVYPGNPLTSDRAYRDWWRALDWDEPSTRPVLTRHNPSHA